MTLFYQDAGRRSTGATSDSNGSANTNAIVVDSSCTASPFNCSAQLCQSIGFGWYLPAFFEMDDVRDRLCANSVIPCDFGAFRPRFTGLRRKEELLLEHEA